MRGNIIKDFQDSFTKVSCLDRTGSLDPHAAMGGGHVSVKSSTLLPARIKIIKLCLMKLPFFGVHIA